MKAKHFLKSILAHSIFRHRQHHRLIRNIGMHARQFGPGRGLLVIGALALAGRFLQKRRAAHAAHVPELQSHY